jgi:hypothetical protein
MNSSFNKNTIRIRSENNSIVIVSKIITQDSKFLSENEIKIDSKWN